MKRKLEGDTVLGEEKEASAETSDETMSQSVSRRKTESESDVVEVENKIDINSASLSQLLGAYNASCSADDVAIFGKLRKAFKKELDVLPVFGAKGTEKISKLSNPLLAHSSKANIILSCLNDVRAYNTALQYSEEKMKTAPNPGGFYDIRFILPILCHVLDEKNICDALKVVQNGWIYFIMRGMSLRDPALRKSAFLSFKRLVFSLQQAKLAKSQDVKVWLFVLHAIRWGVQQLGECRVSHLVSTWLVAAWEVLRQPSHPMYPRLTKCLLARPVLEMSIIPDFIPFYNASDGNKESREWILNVLFWGLKETEDWKIAQKLPIVKLLCSSFLLEKLKTKKNIVGILNRGARSPEVADLLIDKYSLPLWIAGIVTRDSFLQAQLSKLLTSLRSSCTPNPSRETMFEFVARKMQANNAAAALASTTDQEEDAGEDEQVDEKPTV